jgi:hypothetical protein
VPGSPDHLSDWKLPVKRRTADQQQSVWARISVKQIAVRLLDFAGAVRAQSERNSKDIWSIGDGIFRGGHDQIEIRGRDARITKMDRAHDLSRPLSKCPNDRNTSMTCRNCEIGRLSIELRPGIGRDAHEGRPEQTGLQAPELVVAQPFLLERQPKCLGQCKYLIIVAAVRPEQRPDPHFLACLVVHADGGH